MLLGTLWNFLNPLGDICCFCEAFWNLLNCWAKLWQFSCYISKNFLKNAFECNHKSYLMMCNYVLEPIWMSWEESKSYSKQTTRFKGENKCNLLNLRIVEECELTKNRNYSHRASEIEGYVAKGRIDRANSLESLAKISEVDDKYTYWQCQHWHGQ